MIRHRFDEQMQCDVLDVGGRTYPVKHWRASGGYGAETRQAIIEFENRWGLSVIWGSMNYGDNYHHHGPFGDIWTEETQPFVEEPERVEVGVFLPEGVHRILPGLDPETADYFNDRYPADPKTVEYMKQDKETALACDPFGWCNAAKVNDLAERVMTLPSHPDDVEAIGKELEAEAWTRD